MQLMNTYLIFLIKKCSQISKQISIFIGHLTPRPTSVEVGYLVGGAFDVVLGFILDWNINEIN
jgi:hypothetical protein